MNLREMSRSPVLINTVGHYAGALLFCVILILFWRSWRIHGIRAVKLPFAAAALALGWNLGSLVILGSAGAHATWLAFVAAASFSMLSFLPAVLLQVAIQGQSRTLIAAGYVLSTISSLLHVGELFWSNIRLHEAALLLMAIGFGGLALLAFANGWTKRRAASLSQSVSLACLVLFTTSFLHFGYHDVSLPWTAEVTWHHVSIPVALIVLLRDYRFLLLDTFLRFLVNFGLAALYLASVLAISLEFHLASVLRSNMFLMGGSLVAACLSLILFAYVRNALQAWMSRTIFRRRSVAAFIRKIDGLALTAPSENELLARAAQHVAEFLRTDEYTIAEAGHTNSLAADSFQPEAEMPIRLSTGETRHFLFGRRRGGQRYWSDDLSDLRLLTTAIVEQVERYRSEELRRLVMQAELRALQAQINPHFLFNALNTLYGTIDRGSHDARRMVLNMAEIFRYVLQAHRTLIPLSEELRIVQAYLDIESLRFGDRLTSELIVSESARGCLIPILSVQPLVENAVKHGASSKSTPSKITVRAEVVPEGVSISVEDTGGGFANAQKRPQNGMGLGLENVRRRLTLSFGASAELQIKSDDSGSIVAFLIPHPDKAMPHFETDLVVSA